MTEIIALFNQSGGVGKTTLAMNLGYQLSAKGQRVLLIDFDPQSSLTIFMGIDIPWDLEKTVYHAIVQREALPVVIQNGLTLSPSNLALAGAEIELMRDGMRDIRLKNALAPIQDDYDFILIDCPPNLGMLSTMALHSATHILIPVQTEFKCWRSTEYVLNTVMEFINGSNPNLKIKGFVPTLYSSGKSHHVQALMGIQDQLSQFGTVFPVVPNRIAFVNASEARQPLAVFAPKSDAVAILDQICDRLIAKELVHA